MRIIDKNFKEILTSQMIATLGGLIAGTFLALHEDKILWLPGILILLPGFLEMRGNISGSFASRLSSGLLLGVINPRKLDTKLIRENLFASFFLAILVSSVLGLIAFSFNSLVTGIFIPEIIFVPILAGIIANLIEIFLTLGTTFYVFRKGYDPNNIMGPFITSTGDITSIVSLLLSLLLIRG